MDKKAKKKERRAVKKENLLINLRALWDSMEIKSDYWSKAQRLIVQKIKKNQFRYEEVEKLVWKQYDLFIPWPVIACIHAMEAGLDSRNVSIMVNLGGKGRLGFQKVEGLLIHGRNLLWMP